MRNAIIVLIAATVSILAVGTVLADVNGDSPPLPPHGEIPPQFGPQNPNPDSTPAPGVAVRELWRVSYQMDSLLQRIAGLNPSCSDPCLRDDAPAALAGAMFPTCSDVRTSATQADSDPGLPPSERAFPQLVRGICDDYDRAASELGDPDPASSDWRAEAQLLHESLDVPLSQFEHDLGEKGD
jgi:hypothetical protein